MRKDERRHQAACRDRGLADPERETTLRGAEPVHDRTSARGVDARAGRSGQAEERDQPAEVGRVRGSSQERGAAAEPDPQHQSLPEAVGGEPPRQERQQRADPLGGKNDPDLGEAQPVAALDRRRERRQTDSDRREARLRGRAAGEDDPAIRMRRRRYSPNGLNGLALVDMRTLLVSR